MNTKLLPVLLLVVTLVSGCITVNKETKVISSTEEKPILDTGEIMKLLMDPIHEDLKDWIENPPEKRKDWRGLYVASYTLAEINNLLYSRTDHEYMLTAEWRDLVTESRAVAAHLANSVKERHDYATVKANYLAVIESCNTCHSRYDPTEEDAPMIERPRAWMN